MAEIAINDDKFIQSELTKSALSTYFGITSINSDQRMKISNVLRSTRVGIGSNIIIKLKDLGDGIEGLVKFHKAEKAATTRIPHEGSHTGQINLSTLVYNTDEHRYKDAGQNSGFIYRVKNLIHEATHRFANTDDKAYFDQSGTNVEKYFECTNLSECSINNADSYGWFTVKIASGRSFIN